MSWVCDDIMIHSFVTCSGPTPFFFILTKQEQNWGRETGRGEDRSLCMTPVTFLRTLQNRAVKTGKKSHRVSATSIVC